MSGQLQITSRIPLEVQGKIIEYVINMKYLGINISSDSNIYKNLKFQAIKGTQMSGHLLDITWENKYMSVKIEIIIYKTMINQ